MYHKLFKRQSKKLFNTPWEFVIGTEIKTFKECYNKMEKIIDKILSIAKYQKKQNYTQFSIREYDEDAWGNIVVFKIKKYNLKLKVIK